jgi:hypothetical protein
MAERYKRLAERQEGGLAQQPVGSAELDERPLKELRDELRALLIRARKAQSNLPSR